MKLPWLPFLTLVSAFALSQAFRTVTAMMATGLQQDFGLSAQQLGFFAAISGFALGLGGLGLVITGTPLAWLISMNSWRVGFALLAGLACISWVLVCVQLREGLPSGQQRPQSLQHALRGFGALFLLPQTLGILALALVSYASFLTLRGLWLGPLLMHRHGMSLVQTGNVALVVYLLSLFSPALFGHFDPGTEQRRRWIVGSALAMAGIIALMALLPLAWVAVGSMMVLAVVSGAGVLQYANERASYRTEMSGRAMSVFTIAMFFGVAIVQSLSGLAAFWSLSPGYDSYAGVLVCVASLLAAGAFAFRLLPAGEN